MLAIRLDKKIEERLTKLALKTGRTKTYYAREAILEHLEELEDTHLALDRLASPGRVYSAAEVKRALGL
jgi:RHH-type rel operon transcriptional repressor/antitoxin RelB